MFSLGWLGWLDPPELECTIADRHMPRALLSVSDKSRPGGSGRRAATPGLELVSTGGTARALADAGLPVTNVSDVTRFPEMMDGRVKTLHPLIHGGILARRDRSDDLDAAKRHGIGLIDVVVVNLYPFVETAAKPDVTFEALIEQIDIGGPEHGPCGGKELPRRARRGRPGRLPLGAGGA